jgi:hypothetical protein
VTFSALVSFVLNMSTTCPCPGHLSAVLSGHHAGCDCASHVSVAVDSHSFSRGRSRKVRECKYFNLSFCNCNTTQHNTRNQTHSHHRLLAYYSCCRLIFNLIDRTLESINQPPPDPYLPNYWPDSTSEYHTLFATFSSIIAYAASFQNWLVVELLLLESTQIPQHTDDWPPPLQHLPRRPYWVLGSPSCPMPQTPQITQASNPCCLSCPFWLLPHPFLTPFCQKLTKHAHGSPPTLQLSMAIF